MKKKAVLILFFCLSSLSFAETGNVSTQWENFVMYYKGKGVTQVYTEAIKWYLKAAVQGYASA